MWLLPCPRILVCFSERTDFTRPSLPLPSEASQLKSLEWCVLSPGALGVPSSWWGRPLGEVLPVAYGRLPVGARAQSAGTASLYCPLVFLICLFLDLLPPTHHSSPVSVLGTLLEGNGFLQLCSVLSQRFTSLSPWARCPWNSPAPLCQYGEGAALGQSSSYFPTVCKLMVFFF